MNREELQNWILEYLKDTEYELVTLTISKANDILVEVDRLAGVDVDFCADLNRYLVEKLDQMTNDKSPMTNDKSPMTNDQSPMTNDNYSLEVGSVSLTDSFKTKTQYLKNLGHDVEVLAKGDKDEWRKFKGQLVSVDDDTFSVDIAEKVVVEGKKRKETRVITRTWRYDEPKYVKYDLKF